MKTFFLLIFCTHGKILEFKRSETCDKQSLGENERCMNICFEEFTACYEKCTPDDIDCKGLCFRKQIHCEENCPCNVNCPDGCPCETFKCQFVCLKPDANNFWEIQQPRVSPVTLKLKQGEFIGQEYRLGKFQIFKGVPFAEPPTGPNRWLPPKSVNNWNVPKKGKNRTPQCPQIVGTRQDYSKMENAGLMSEDCLYMDIWRPAKGYHSKLPILIWIHGGALSSGNADRSIGSYLNRKDVIVVFIQYRLGIFGFMNTWEENGLTSTPGNYGLLDQQMAISFVRQNAENIGGDPTRITLMGESAGSWSVGYQLLSQTCNIINGAVHQSGAPVFGMSNQESKYANDAIQKHTKAANLEVRTPDENVEALRTVKAVDIIYNDFLFFSTENDWPLWTPVRYDGKFFMLDAEEKLNDGQVCKIPYLFGTNSFEGSVMYFDEIFMDGFEAGATNLGRVFDYLNGYSEGERTLTFKYLDTVPKDQQKSIINKYFKEYKSYFDVENKSDLTKEQTQVLAAIIFGDVWCRKYSHEVAKIYNFADVPVHNYHIDVEFPIDWMFKRPGFYNGTGHADDISLIFGYPYVNDINSDHPEEDYWPWHFCSTEPSPWQYAASDIMVENIVEFIKTGEVKDFWKTYDPVHFQSNQMKVTNDRTTAYSDIVDALDPMLEFWINEYVES